MVKTMIILFKLQKLGSGAWDERKRFNLKELCTECDPQTNYVPT